MSELKCADCNTDCHSADYYVKDQVWSVAWPGYLNAKKAAVKKWGKHHARSYLLLCLSCLAKRLGRPLVPEDFNWAIAVNLGGLAGNLYPFSQEVRDKLIAETLEKHPWIREHIIRTRRYYTDAGREPPKSLSLP